MNHNFRGEEEMDENERNSSHKAQPLTQTNHINQKINCRSLEFDTRSENAICVYHLKTDSDICSKNVFISSFSNLCLDNKT